MRCLICGKNYISVGVHIRHKHGVTPEEYREEFGLLKTAPLVDDDLSQYLSKNKTAYLNANPEARDEATARLKGAARVETMRGVMSRAGREKLAERNSARNKEYLNGKAGVVSALLSTGHSLVEVRKIAKVAQATVRGMIRAGIVEPHDRGAVETRRRAKVLETRAKARAEEIGKIIALYDSDLSLREICRRAGVGYTSYKRWVNEGKIPRRSTYMAEVVTT